VDSICNDIASVCLYRAAWRSFQLHCPGVDAPLFCYAGLRDMRNIPLFALVAIPPLADQLNSLISIKVETSPPTRLGSWINLLLVVLAVVAVAHDSCSNLESSQMK